MSGVMNALRGRLRHVVRLIAPFAVLAAAPLAVDGQTLTGVRNHVTVRYADANGTTGASEAGVTVVVDRGASVRLFKRVDRALAGAGDTLTYTLRWESNVLPAGGLVLEDTLPAGITYVPASAVVHAGATVLRDGNIVRVLVEEPSAASDSIQFRAVVTMDSGIVRNHAALVLAGDVTAVAALSDTTTTQIIAPQLALHMDALVNGAVRAGDTITFRIRVENTSAQLTVRNVLLTDSLPDGLRFIDAQPEALRALLNGAGAGAATTAVSWDLGALAPLQSRDILVRALVLPDAPATITNMAIATGAGVTRAVTAVAVVLIGDPIDPVRGIALRRSASALEVGRGEVIGFTLDVTNTGAAPLDGVVLHELIPAGLELQPASVRGAALERAGDALRFALGTLAIGQTVRVQYAATANAAYNAQLRNVAWAEAATGERSDSAVASVRVRDVALTSTLIVGKVWLDANGDGRQQSDEDALEQAVIWSSHGELVRADREGRFTFPNVVPGRYTLRVDPLSVPTGFTNSDAVSVRVDGWSTPSVNFALQRDTTKRTVTEPAQPGIVLSSGVVVPRPRIATPANGATIGSNRVFVRVEGEPSAEVELYAGTELIRKSTLRPDGSEDFIGVELEPGPHKLETVVRGMAGEQRHAVTVHVSGAPVRALRTDTVPPRAGETKLIAVRVLDEWGVAVAHMPQATVRTNNVRIMADDQDASSTGVQLIVAKDGTLLIPIRGDSAGAARIAVEFGRSVTELSLTLLPEIRPLTVVADGELGIGAATQSYGAISARGALDDRTALTITFDSRRRAAEAFGGVVDALDETRYPLLGDASERQVLRSATARWSARLERDASWLLLGDIDTRAFGDENMPGHYRRALPGFSARIGGDMFSISGFGSVVSQQLVQRQLRGDGTSGPYRIGGSVRLGTDRIVIETRDANNASLVLARQELERFVDYDIDAQSGAVLLRRPLMSTDASGNPLMLVALAEQLDGEGATVAGVRAEANAARMLGMSDSVTVGAAYVEDANQVGGHTLMSADVQAQSRLWGGSLSAARGATTDSAGFALLAQLRAGSTADSLRGVNLLWSRVSDGFANPANPRLVAGTEDLRISAHTRIADAWLVGGGYQRQWFRARGAERARTNLTVARSVGAARITLDGSLLQEELATDSALATFNSVVGRVAYARGQRSVWLEAAEPISGTAQRPRTIGLGTSWNVGYGVVVEAAHRIVGSDSARHGVSTVGVRSELPTRTTLWSQYELASSVSGHASAALVGIGQKVEIAQGFSIDAQFERRVGLDAVPVTDPSRALPFAQAERNGWSAALGTEWSPSALPVRASLRGELHDREDTGRGYRMFGSAEAALAKSWALLLRQDMRSEAGISAGEDATAQVRSVTALAYRPAERSDWSALARVEWRSDENPRQGGVTALSGENRRIIGGVDVIYTPSRETEFSVRYAVRNALLSGALGGDAEIRAQTHYAGARARRALHERVDLRTTARMLIEREAELLEWEIAPALGFTIMPGLELEAGYRFGTLADIDFGTDNGSGWYASLGMSITESSARTLADYWRARMAAGSR
jgi:uncharacterized repeat protein (TIGR01451 family)